MMRPALQAVAGAIALAAAFWALAQVAVPNLTARVTDLTGTLTRSETAALEARLASFEAEQGTQVAVLMVPTTAEEPIEAFGIRVADAWKLGREAVDDGAILIVAKDDRRLRIEAGYGLEGAIPDAIAKRIISEIITPYFRRGDYYTGISAGVDAILAAAANEPLPEPSPASQAGGDRVDIGFAILMGVVALGWTLRKAIGTVPASLLGAVVVGTVVTLLVAVGPALFMALVAAVLIAGGGRGGGGGLVHSGGYRGGGGGFGRGGGGFRGGGGGFGGGGASGSW